MFDDNDRVMFPDFTPAEIENAPIDITIRDSIVRINKSKWVRTVYSCQGHKDRKTGSVMPSLCCFHML